MNQMNNRTLYNHNRLYNCMGYVIIRIWNFANVQLLQKETERRSRGRARIIESFYEDFKLFSKI